MKLKTKHLRLPKCKNNATKTLLLFAVEVAVTLEAALE